MSEGKSARAPSEQFLTGVRRFEIGVYENALGLFSQALAADPSDADARYYLHLTQRRLAPKPPARPTIVWQFDPVGSWERDWLSFLLGDIATGETVDNTWTRIVDPMIVIDNRLVSEKLPYYRAAFEQGARIVLVHLSDEAFRDDRGIYRYCDAVIRNYRSSLLAHDARVLTVPLGCKAEFTTCGVPPRPAAERKHLWAFAGDLKKLTRAAMLAAMNELGNGRCFATESFGSADSLPTPAYRAMLDETVVAPCPGGWANLETFRVYEALEAGCIPIVERRPGFDYFTDLLGPHPIPTIDAWSDVPPMVRAWQKSGTLEGVRLACHAWWEAYKPRIAATVHAHVAATFGL